MIASRQRSRRRRRRTLALGAAALLVAAAIFAAGVALGMALHDNPAPGSTETTTKTILP